MTAFHSHCEERSDEAISIGLPQRPDLRLDFGPRGTLGCGERGHPMERCEVAGTGGRFVLDDMFREVTLYPAEILGIADRVGTLDVGKDADLIVTTGDPLEVVTDVVYEFIQGRPVLLESKHTRLYEKFRQRTEKR